MKNISYQILLFIVFFFQESGFSQEKKTCNSKPNIIVFLVDDMGWQDSSVPFYIQKTKWNDFYRTPNLERLTTEGMKFTNAYASPVCTPSRISLLTGMSPINHKVTNWTLEKNKSNEGEPDVLIPPKWNINGLSPVADIENTIHATTIPKLLKQNGYFTIHIGKAHFAAKGTPGENPLQFGYDINVAGHAAGSPGSYYGLDNFGNKKEEYNIWATPGLEKYWGQNIFLTEALTKEAISALDKAQETGKPFFLYLAHYAIHTPIMEDQRFVQKYYDLGINPIEAKYASLIEGVDKSLGDIMNYLNEKNISKNTIIVFLSDNGGLSAHTRGGELNYHNTPLRSGKGSAYEGGTRIPMVIKWPDTTQENTFNGNNVIIEDLFPTILEMSGVKKYNTVQTIDGKSIVPLLKQHPEKNNRFFYWHYPHVWGPEGPALKMYSVVRQGNWKLIYFHESQQFELYNTLNDIGEQNNLIDTNFDIAKKLASQLGKYLRKAKTEMPINKITKKTILYPDDAIISK
jgi:arylsulfatase A-like enzyme